MTGLVVRHGQPTEQELGIVVAVLTAAIASRVDPAPTQHAPLRNWATPATFHRPVVRRPGRGAWVLSGRA